MKVKLISHSQPVSDLEGIEDAQDLVAYCARVSNPANQFNTETSERLIRYLIRHQHWSPLEMVSACLEITTTRDIARQILRHRSFSFQEFSQRYADPTQDLSFDIREARLQDPDNRQNSVALDFANLEHREISREWQDRQHQVRIGNLSMGSAKRHRQRTGSCCIARRHDAEPSLHERNLAIMGAFHPAQECQWYTTRAPRSST